MSVSPARDALSMRLHFQDAIDVCSSASDEDLATSTTGVSDRGRVPCEVEGRAVVTGARTGTGAGVAGSPAAAKKTVRGKKNRSGFKGTRAKAVKKKGKKPKKFRGGQRRS